MKSTKFFNLITAALTLVVIGCRTTHTSLQVSGTPGAQFTAQYRAGAYSGSVTAVTQTRGPETVLELPGRGLTCDVSKKDRAAHLTVELRQTGKVVFRAEAPAGTQGVRVSRTASGWMQETY
jgi:hypothetical protein